MASRPVTSSATPSSAFSGVSRSAAARDRAEAICNQFVFAHFDIDGTDLGYEIIGILDKDGGNAAACTVD